MGDGMYDGSGIDYKRETDTHNGSVVPVNLPPHNFCFVGSLAIFQGRQGR